VEYGLGVDLGTTYTAAAVRHNGHAEVARLGSRRAEIPSVVFVRPDGRVLIGEAAERRGAEEPGRLAREFKRRVGDPVPLLVGGSPYPAHALMARLLEEGSRRGLRAFFLGARPEVVAELARRCARDYPGLVVAGYRDGYFGPAKHEGIVEEIRQAAPHMLFVGMPSPFKETWCERHRAALDVPLIMGVGGAFDVLAGYVPRAPRLVQSLGLEWSWRLAMEPRKLWKRYLVTNSEYLWLAAGEILKRRIGLAGRAGY